MKAIYGIIFLLLSVTLLNAQNTNTVIGVDAADDTKGTENSDFGYRAGKTSGINRTKIANFGSNSGYFAYGSSNVAVGCFSGAQSAGTAQNYSDITILGAYAGVGMATPGTSHSLFGFQAGYSMNFGYYNTAFGANSLYKCSYTVGNTGIGYSSLHEVSANYDHLYNTAIGYEALRNNTALNNVSIGYQSARNNTTSTGLTTVGANTLANGNYEQGFNTVVGYNSYVNGGGIFDTATGYSSLSSNGNSLRTAFGGVTNSEGYKNTSFGYMANTYTTTTGENNLALGTSALINNIYGDNNVAVGYLSGPNTSNLLVSTAIGANSVTTSSYQIQFGDVAVTVIGGKVNWSTPSDARFKRDIREDVAGLDFITKLRPVSYLFDDKALEKLIGTTDNSRVERKESSSNLTYQTGLIAQEVEALVKNTNAVFYGVDAPENEKDHYRIQYDEFVIPLIKAVQELHAKVENNKIRQNERQFNIQQLFNELLLLNQDVGINDSGLSQNESNPFSTETKIQITLASSVTDAYLYVYTINGEQWKSYPIKDRGTFAVKILANEFPPNPYIYALVADNTLIGLKYMTVLAHPESTK